MFEYLSGIVSDINGFNVIIDVNGVGYSLLCSASAVGSLKVGEKAKIYAYLAVREDDVSLYGFDSKAEKNIFLRLIEVSGIGAKGAIGILSSISADELALCIVNGDVKRLNSVKGIGKKTAERIVLELRDKLNLELKDSAVTDYVPVAEVSDDALMALMSLGFNKNEAAKALANVDKSLPVEEMIRLALKNKR